MNDLIRRLQQGDESVVKELYQQFYHHCKWVVLNNGGTDEDAREVFQQVVLSLWEKVERGNFTVKTTLKGYLYNACKYVWWNIKKKQLVNEPLDNVHHLPETDDYEEESSTDRQYKMLYGCINELGGECERLLEQTYFENLSDKAIADLLNLKINYIRVKRKRCMDRVKKCVQQKQLSHG